jgi:septal ring factor EnvC (AmiA/AmiB activator)
MIKKLIVVAVVGGLAVAAFKGTKWASYMRSEVRSWKEAAEDAVPPEKEIARLRGEVKMLDEDTLKIVKQLARLQSDQSDLTARLKLLDGKKAAYREKLDKQAVAVRAAEEKAKAGESKVLVAFGDVQYSLSVGKVRLKETVRDYTDTEKEIAHVRAKLDVQQRIIDKLEKQRLEMTRLKTDLDTAIDGLEEEVQTLKLAQMESAYQTDDTRVAQIKESIARQKKRLDVQRRELALLQDTMAPAVPAATESVDEILAPVTGEKAANPALPKAGD